MPAGIYLLPYIFAMGWALALYGVYMLIRQPPSIKRGRASDADRRRRCCTTAELVMCSKRSMRMLTAKPDGGLGRRWATSASSRS